MKALKNALAMPQQLIRRSNYKITEVSQIHMITFWITLTMSSVLTIAYFVCKH